MQRMAVIIGDACQQLLSGAATTAMQAQPVYRIMDIVVERQRSAGQQEWQ